MTSCFIHVKQCETSLSYDGLKHFALAQFLDQN